MTLRLLSYNVRFGGAGREAQLAASIRAADPDLVVLQEATQPRVVERLAAETGLKNWAAHAGYSLAFLSRLPVARHEWHRPRGSRRHFVEIEPEGLGLHVYGVHLSAVHSFFTERRRMRELRSMLAWVGTRETDFHVFTGDFNTLAPGDVLHWRQLPMRLRPMVWLSGGSVRYQTIQIMLASGYLDAFRQLHPKEVRGYTFPTWDPHVRLDFVFLPERFRERLKECRVLTDEPVMKDASDHFPLLAEFAT
ncbi:MAG: endonuclease/exonuclease/phosphatase family protein [Acidobacteria bacterium]|nr:endonuclease/exonuclease/phosphatase family protein [Acidobacteriota bacterium]MCA1618423.1 endonuclease/exonuclease/phosphatase family protein [Acidobacteriota bacterium]